MSNKLTFKKASLSSSVKWNFNEFTSNNKDYVYHGKDNKASQHLINFYNKSSIHAACINAIVDGVVGQGLTANNEEYLKYANSTGESWNDIFKKVALDYKLHGSFALELIYSRDRSKVEVYHMDYSYIRCLEKDHRGNVPGYVISSDWDKKSKWTKKEDDLLVLPSYTKGLSKNTNELFVFTEYRPGQEYYPLPDYVGAIKIIELDTEIDNFHTNNIKNGLVPSLSITTFTNGDEDQLRSMVDAVESSYGGSDNAGSVIFMDAMSKESAPVIAPVPTNNTDTYYTDINDMVVQKILTAHRITSPMILGIKTEGQLGGRDEVVDAYLLLQNNVINPIQQKVVGALENIMSFNYPDIILGVEQKKLYDDGTEEEEVVTDGDTTDAEDKEIDNTNPTQE